MFKSKQLNEKRQGSINHLKMTEEDHALSDRLINKFRSDEFGRSHEEAKNRRFEEHKLKQNQNPFYTPKFSHRAEMLDYINWLEELSK
jgi:hypothetical protein